MKGDKYTAWFLPALTLAGLSVTFVAGNIARLFTHEIKIVNGFYKAINITLKSCEQLDDFSLQPGEEVEHSVSKSCKEGLKFYIEKNDVGHCSNPSDGYRVKIMKFPITETDCSKPIETHN